jgi:MEMO1 family protein
MSVREPAVAGLFYPADPEQLTRAVDEYLAGAPEPAAALTPKAVIAPHAGYVYSGPIAGSAFAAVSASAQRITRVVLLGPSHFVPFHGLALDSAAEFATPMGRIGIDDDAVSSLRAFPQVTVLGAAHRREHCLEVELPFLQRILDQFTLIPLVVGESSPEEAGAVLEKLWGGEETLVVVSSDLSHYLDYGTACVADRETSHQIIALGPNPLRPDQACGCRAINALLEVARRRRLTATLLDLRNSGDTAGGREQVVGYGAFAFS